MGSELGRFPRGHVFLDRYVMARVLELMHTFSVLARERFTAF